MVGSLGPGLNNRRSAAAHARAAAAVAAAKGGSIVFNGSSSYLNLASDADLQFSTGNWTFEAFVYVSATSGVLFDYRPVATSGAYPCMLFNANKLTYIVNGTSAITGTVTMSTNAWHHVAWSKSSGTLRQFVDGVQDGLSYSDSVNYASGFLTIGRNSNTGTSGYISGNITNIRITKGQALYVSNFGPPNAPMTAGANTKLLLLASTSGTALADSSGLNKTVTNHSTTWSNSNPF